MEIYKIKYKLKEEKQIMNIKGMQLREDKIVIVDLMKEKSLRKKDERRNPK